MVTAVEEQADPNAELRDEITEEFRSRGILAEGESITTAAELPPSLPHVKPDPADQLSAIEEFEREVAAAESIWNGLKDDCKDAKAEYEAKVRQLRSMIRASALDADRPLLNGQAEAAEAKPEPEAWRAVTMESLGFGARILKALTEADLTTIGKLADWTKEYEISAIKGIGPAAAEEIAERMDQYWRENPVESNEPEQDCDDDK